MEDTSYISPKNLGSLHKMRAQITIQRELLLRSSACFILLKLGFHATMNQKQKWEQQQSGTQGKSQVKNESKLQQSHGYRKDKIRITVEADKCSST
jgi:hypothetical protein